MEVERAACNESFGELVSLGVVSPLNRDNESSLKLSSDNLSGCDLLTEDDRRPAGFDEPEHLGPQVALIGCSGPLAGVAEGLAGAGAGPAGSAIRPSSEAQGEAPSADAGEQVGLGESVQVSRSNIDN